MLFGLLPQSLGRKVDGLGYKLWVAPSQDSSHHQDYEPFLVYRGSQPKPSFPTGILGGGHTQAINMNHPKHPRGLAVQELWNEPYEPRAVWFGATKTCPTKVGGIKEKGRRKRAWKNTHLQWMINVWLVWFSLESSSMIHWQPTSLISRLHPPSPEMPPFRAAGDPVVSSTPLFTMDPNPHETMASVRWG